MHEARTLGSSLKMCGCGHPSAGAEGMGAALHEFSVARALMQQIEAEAASRGAIAVERVILRIGDLSGIDIERLATAYLTVRNRTICARAPLEITPVRPEWRCGVCGRAVRGGIPVRCRACGGAAALRGGDEIVLDRIEIEVM